MMDCRRATHDKNTVYWARPTTWLQQFSSLSLPCIYRSQSMPTGCRSRLCLYRELLLATGCSGHL